jgi:pyruvyl transferase EpsO
VLFEVSALVDIRRTLQDALADAVDGHDACALLMFRDADNFGDAAIWLGALRMLDDLRVSVRYSQPLYVLHPRGLRSVVGDGPVLVNGGGSFGDVYRKTQRFLYRVVETFPERRVVVLPQTVYFETPDGLEAAKRVMGTHRDLVLMCRDHASFETARAAFDCDVQLVPDLAFALGPQPAPPPPHERVLWLLRRDHEAAGRDAHDGQGAVEPCDWEDVLVAEPARARRIRGEELAYRVLRRAVGIVPRLHAGPLFPVASARRLAAARVDAAFALLAPAGCIVTDRLHAHLLATLLGRPSVVCDNRFGKVRSFYETWTASLPGTAWAETPADVAAALARLAPAP